MKKKKEKQAKTFVECHNTCARSSGRTCKFWGCSHRKLYSECDVYKRYVLWPTQNVHFINRSYEE